MGMWEKKEPFYKHNCEVKLEDNVRYHWRCYEYSHNPNELILKINISQCCHDDEYEAVVKICPFCGYKPETLNK